MTVTEDRITLPCVTCGYPIDIVKLGAEPWLIYPHYYCETPRLNLDVMPPKWRVRVTSEDVAPTDR